MNSITSTIKSIIENTPGYTLDTFLGDMGISLTNFRSEHTVSIDPWYTVAQADRYCNKSTVTIRRAAKANLLKSNKKGQNKGVEFSFRRSWLDRWMLKGAPLGYLQKETKQEIKAI
jgi:hypothetical protein